MKNKIILITGATQGIGKITATKLAEQGHTIILHGRNLDKLRAVQQEITQQTGNSSIDAAVCDLLSLQSVQQMCQELQSKYSHLDVLINNADRRIVQSASAAGNARS